MGLHLKLTTRQQREIPQSQTLSLPPKLHSVSFSALWERVMLSKKKFTFFPARSTTGFPKLKLKFQELQTHYVLGLFETVTETNETQDQTLKLWVTFLFN